MPAALAVLVSSAVLCASAAADAPTPRPGWRVDLAAFTVEGVGLQSTPAQVRAALGPPEEEQLISAVVEEEPVEEQGEEGGEGEEGEAPDTRAPARRQGRFVYAYFSKGVRFTFLSDTEAVDTVEICIKAFPPYEAFAGSFAQPFGTAVREEELLRPLAGQIYKDAPHALSLKKDDRAPKRETAQLSFNPEGGWLTRVIFVREENYEIDFDRFTVAGLGIGAPVSAVLERLGPPDRHRARGRDHIGAWDREGLRIHASRDDKRVNRIVVSTRRFDGGSAQGIPLTIRKDAFRAFLEGRVYQETSVRVCAFRKDEPRSRDKLILDFDDADRLKAITFMELPGVEVDLEGFTIGGIKVGDPASKVRAVLGRAGKWRRTGMTMVLGYPRLGIRVHMARDGKRKGGEKGERLAWDELGAVKRVDAALSTSPALHAAPFSLGDPRTAWEKKAAPLIFSRKGDSLYLSPDGKPPAPGVIAVIDFEKIGWPRMVTFREFRDITVDARRFTVAGIGLGTHADEVLRVLGRPERSRVTESGEFEILRYLEKGLVVALDRLDRRVCKITVLMERFEGSFVQDLTPDSNADDFEKALHRQVWTQDEKRLRLSPDGAPPTWEEGLVNFSLSGSVETVVFQTLGVRKEGFLLDVTRELE